MVGVGAIVPVAVSEGDATGVVVSDTLGVSVTVIVGVGVKVGVGDTVGVAVGVFVPTSWIFLIRFGLASCFRGDVGVGVAVGVDVGVAQSGSYHGHAKTCGAAAKKTRARRGTIPINLFISG